MWQFWCVSYRSVSVSRYVLSVAAEPCGPVAHPLFLLCEPGPHTFCVPFFLLVTTEVGHVGGLYTPTRIKYKCRKIGSPKEKQCVGVPLTFKIVPPPLRVLRLVFVRCYGYYKA